MADIGIFINRHKNLNRGYRKLEVWVESIELFALVKKKIKQLNSVSFKTKAQIEDSGISIPSNIAEGYSRRYMKETIQYNSIALASLSENYTQLIALVASDDLEKEWFEDYEKKHYSIENKLIKYNRSLVERFKNSDEWRTDYQVSEIIEPYLQKEKNN